LGLPFAGEGQPVIRTPDDPKWSAISLPWMAFGYGVAVTPLQTLTLYNAVANNGEMVKPQFVKEIREWNRVIKKFDKEIIHPKICSDKTIDKLHAVLENVVKRGTASSLYSKDFSMAGKTGTAQVDYNKGEGNLYYTSSFVGYFPANNPKYSCIVVVHKPNVAKGYYGADVAGPVFKRIAQKIFTDSPTMNKIRGLQVKSKKVDQAYETYIAKSADELKRIPNVKGMPGMDAAALLENLKLKVRVRGIGKVKKQSIPAGEPVKKNETIILELS
jgi:cell division protein FtsI (penicillin-binding protein 3)